MSNTKAQLEYIRQREMAHILSLADNDAQNIARMYKMLDKSLQELSLEMEHWAVSYATDYGLTIQEAEARAKAADIERLAKKAKRYVENRRDRDLAFSADANREMRLYNFSMKMSRAQLLQNEIRLSMIKIAGEQAEALYGTLTEDAERELRRMSGILSLTLPTAGYLKDTARTIATSSFHGMTFSDRIWNNSKKMGEILENGMFKSLVQGKNPRLWMQDMKECLKQAGSQGDYNIERLCLTELSRVRTECKKESYDRAGYENYTILTVSDPCDTCTGEDGKTYALKDMEIGLNAPAYHPNCRCTIVAAEDDPAAIAEQVKKYRAEEKEIKDEEHRRKREEAAKRRSERESIPKTVAGCKNYEDLDDMLFVNHNIRLDSTVQKIDFDLVKEALTGYEAVATKYPEVWKRIKEISTTRNGVMCFGYNYISFNPQYFKNKGFKKIIDQQVAGGYWVSNTSVASIGAHEAGHAVNMCLVLNDPKYSNPRKAMLDFAQDITADDIVAEACRRVQQMPYGKTMPIDIIREAQSGYGATMASEAIAESYADDYANGANANPLSRHIIDIIDERFKRYKGE